LLLVEKERIYYQDMVKKSKEVCQELDLKLQHSPPSCQQPGPMYFLTPRKCGLFGVCCEGIPQQVNYLVDESLASSKGSNSVINYLHHFFDNFGLGEKEAGLHCDNCSGQNKNRFVLWYMAWRTISLL
ncbi:uncharacterized protein LOC130010917, partial [Patella vulgata]|uniref:uncharacterized protein LOC130010917 n=1 Tax=Patella vulgata TaxID=6465 RepID=UPI0024A8F9A9